MRERKCRLAVWAAGAIVLVGIGLFVGAPIVRMAREPERFRQWVAGFGGWGKAMYVAVTALQVVLALIPGEPLEIAGGYAFGALEGTVLALMGIVLGSGVVFILVRCFGPGLVELFFPGRGREPVLLPKEPEKTRAAAFLLMLIPGTPKDLLSYCAGLTTLGLWEWLAIVAVARIPSIVGSAISGGAAGEGNYLTAAAALAVTGAVSGIGLLAYRIAAKRKSEAK